MDGFDSFWFKTKNLEESKEFYEKTLGLSLKPNFDEKGIVAFNVGNEETLLMLADLNTFPKAKTAMWFIVDDVEDEYKRLKEKGVNFLYEPFEVDNGMAAEFEDPSGNKLGIADYKKKSR
jgi:predicted enzyme related to lactoylglutathione lyase